MSEQFSRNELYWGRDFQEYLSTLHVAVFGLGGVGGFALEALARAGVGEFTIVDFDTINISNINRQIIALHSTVGKKKADVFAERLKDINPNIKINVQSEFFDEAYKFEACPDFIVDAIDTLRSKIELIKYAHDNNIKIVSSMGAGNRTDASRLYVCDISEIRYKDSFIKNILSKLKKYANLESGLTVVTSDEKAHNTSKIKNVETVVNADGISVEFTKYTPASTPVVPAVAGYLMANYVLQTCYNEFKSESM